MLCNCSSLPSLRIVPVSEVEWLLREAAVGTVKAHGCGDKQASKYSFREAVEEGSEISDRGLNILKNIMLL